MALVVQDCRGRYGSDGDYVPFVNETRDGEDTLAWLAAQPWCNGRIGMFGDSYLAATQFAVGASGVPALCALNPRFMAGDIWQHAYYCDGAFSLGLTWSWLCFEVSARTSNAASMSLFDVGRLLRELPLGELDVKSGFGVVPAYRDYVAHDRRDAFWQALSVRETLPRCTAPSRRRRALLCWRRTDLQEPTTPGDVPGEGRSGGRVCRHRWDTVPPGQAPGFTPFTGVVAREPVVDRADVDAYRAVFLDLGLSDQRISRVSQVDISL